MNQVKARVLIVVFAYCIVMCSCTRTIYVPVPGETKTEYIVQERVDSLVMHDSVYIKEVTRGDTVYLKEVRYRDREHIVTRYDTISMNDTISVPYEVKVEVARMNGFQSFFFWVGICLMSAMIGWIILRKLLL